ncbi:hypothetical protein [Arthrobacter hankyongi]|nr:hypothetical protein [Arthrobacter hankyongi]
MDESDAAGFGFLPFQHPGDLKDFAQMVVPEMQERGRVQLA